MAGMEYKCTACGGGLEFDSASQKLKCPYCNSIFELSDFQEPEEQETMGASQVPQEGDSSQVEDNMNWSLSSDGEQWDENDASNMNMYSCNSCGGEIVCDETTASTSCPYCGSPIVMKGKMSGVLKPDLIIPFKLDKKAAKEALKKHVESKKLVPALFKDENHINEIKGVYIPFWLFDAEIEAGITYAGERIRRWSDSDADYVEHDYYNIYRQGRVAFDNVPVDGSTKMPDDLMESIEPFDLSQAVEFNSAYLAGYMADKYDVDANASIENANKRIRRSTEEIFNDTVRGYVGVVQKSTNINLQNGTARYALYPVWLLNTKWEGNTYTFAMNGQTGKFVGDLPIDKNAYRSKLIKLAGIFGLIASVAAILVDYLFI